MSYRSGASVPKPTTQSFYEVVATSRGIENGKHYYVAAFGQCAEDERPWQNLDENSDTSPFPKLYAQFWMNEKGAPDEGNKFVRWVYTGSENDPVHVLGLDTKKQDMEKRVQLWGPNSKYVTAQPEVEYVLPVFKVERLQKPVKGQSPYDLDNMKPLLLIVKRGLLGDIIEQAAIFQDEDDPSVYGRVFEINKNLKADMKDMYNVKFMTGTPIDLSNKENVIATLRKKADDDITSVWAEANGSAYGDEGAENVWNYLVTHFKNGDKQALINTYNVKEGSAQYILENFEVISLEDDDE